MGRHVPTCTSRGVRRTACQYFWLNFNFLLQFVDMAVLQNMEKLISSYCSAFGPSLGRDRLEFSLLVQNLTTYYYYQHYM